MIFAVGGGMSMYEGIHRLTHPRNAEGYLLNLLIIGAAVLFEGSSFVVAWRRFRVYRAAHPDAGSFREAIHRSKDPTAFAVLLEDGAALIGLTLAALGITLSHVLGSPVYDGLASICIGLLLAAVAAVLAYESRDLLIGESASRRVVRSIRECAKTAEGVQDVKKVLTMQLGPDNVLVALELVFEPALDARQLSMAAERLQSAIRSKHPYIQHVYADLHAIRT
jgi:cation diffusion facilitator family transporter